MYRVLIVDDEQIIRKGLQGLPWEENGMTVVAALKNGLEAQEWLNGNETDILLTDVKMPVVSGIELAKIALELYPNLKVVLLTGYSEFEYAREALRLGVFNYVLKPSTPKEIMECMKSACEKINSEKLSREEMNKLKSDLDKFSVLVKSDEGINVDEEDKINKIIQYIYSNYNKEITLTVLSQEFYFTTVYMSSYIKKCTGHTFLEILTSVRMYYAAKYLKETKFKNGEICHRVGINDERYFGQIFKKSYGMTPYEYRKIGEQVSNPFEKFMEQANNV